MSTTVYDEGLAVLATDVRFSNKSQAGHVYRYQVFYVGMQTAASAALGRNRALWVSDASTNVYELRVDGSFIGYHIMFAGQISGIALGTDGNMWFALDAAPGEPGAIGRLTASGDYTQFTLHSRPTSIAVDPAGGLWLAEDNLIGRVLPDGSETEYKLPRGEEVQFIAGSAEQVVWFSTDDSIGRLETDGRYSRITTKCCPRDLALAPDGALWVAFNPLEDAAVGRLDEWTSRGEPVATIPLDFPLGSVAVSPDDSVWFGGQSSANDVLGQVRTGHVQLEHVPQGPVGQIIALHDSIWFVWAGGLRRYARPSGG